MQIEPIARFNDALRRLGADEGRILLAVSGGPDSLAMLLLAHSSIPKRIAAATVDHELRPEAAAEARLVGSLCARLKITHHILTPDQPIRGNIQSAARTARYALLEKTADEMECTLIATAHHADDQLETLLMRLARGSGIDGMSAIRERNGRIIRPMLEYSKAELEDICLAANIQPIHDPSNEDADYDRVAIRQWLSSADHPFDAGRAVLTARAMQDASSSLAWMTQQLSATRISTAGNILLCDARSLPHDLKRRLLLAALAQLEPELRPRGDAIERLLAELGEGKTTTIGNTLCKGAEIWQLSAAPPRRHTKQGR